MPREPTTISSALGLASQLGQGLGGGAVHDPGLRVHAGVAGQPLDELLTGGAALVVSSLTVREIASEAGSSHGHDQAAARTGPARGVLEATRALSERSSRRRDAPRALNRWAGRGSALLPISRRDYGMNLVAALKSLRAAMFVRRGGHVDAWCCGAQVDVPGMNSVAEGVLGRPGRHDVRAGTTSTEIDAHSELRRRGGGPPAPDRGPACDAG